MKPKATCKIVIDSIMTILLIAQMGLQFWASAAHEWIGAGMFILFIAHHVLNLNWYKTMFKGKYTLYRILQFIVDGLVFVAMIGLMVSGIMLSQYVFAFLSISEGKAFARTLHMLSAYWGYVLMALHLGLHWNLIFVFLRKCKENAPSSAILKGLLSLAGIVITLYGVYVFIHRELLSYMLLQTLFVFFDDQESKFLFYLDYLAMMGGLVWIAQNIIQPLSKYPTKKKW